jgi:hypothetical protein
VALPEELGQALRELLHDPHMPLTNRPILYKATERDQRPYPVAFRAWAEKEALDFDRRFGDLISITIGGRPYPGSTAPER